MLFLNNRTYKRKKKDDIRKRIVYSYKTLSLWIYIFDESAKYDSSTSKYLHISSITSSLGTPRLFSYFAIALLEIFNSAAKASCDIFFDSLSSLRIFGAASNLLYFTNYSGYNPEVSYSGGNALAMGTDYGSYPLSKRFTFGLKLTF